MRNARLPRTKNVGEPWLRRSLVSGSARQSPRIRSRTRSRSPLVKSTSPFVGLRPTGVRKLVPSPGIAAAVARENEDKRQNEANEQDEQEEPNKSARNPDRDHAPIVAVRVVRSKKRNPVSDTCFCQGRECADCVSFDPVVDACGDSRKGGRRRGPDGAGPLASQIS